MNKRIWQPVSVAICVISVLLVACTHSYKEVQLQGFSMAPNFTDGQIFQIFDVPLSELKRGDLVLMKRDGEQLIKRLVGLPNETISIHDGKIFINGTPLVEPYKTIPLTYTVDETKLDSDSYFVLGDNRPYSSDSHAWGPAKGSEIKGKAVP